MAVQPTQPTPTGPASTFPHLCVMARHVLNGHPEAAYTDVVDAVKSQAARARVRYDSETVKKAIDAVMHSTRYRGPARTPPGGRAAQEPAAPPPPIPRAHAAPASVPIGGFNSLGSILAEVIRRKAIAPSGEDRG